MTTNTVEEKRRCAPPPWCGEKHEIPPEKRTYALSLTSGCLVVLNEKWLPDPDKAGEFAKVADTLDNNGKYPLLTYEEACEVYRRSEEEDEPFSIIFAQRFGRERLTIDQVGKLAHIPRVYALKLENTKKAKKVAMRAREDDMLKSAGIDAAAVFKDLPKKK